MKTVTRFIQISFATVLLLASSATYAGVNWWDENGMWVEVDPEEQAMADNCNSFAFRLFQQTRGNQDQVLSPLSVTYALSLLNNGADGQTRQEISQALGFGDTSLEAVNTFCHQQMLKCDTIDPLTRMQLANAVFVNQPRQLMPTFRSIAEEYYDAWVESRDFGDGQTRGVINQWGSDHTNGMIPEVLDEATFNPLAASYLLNAVWFKGTWTLKFDPAETQEEAFGSTGKTVPMMHQHERLYYTEDATCQALALPYGNQAYRMTVLLPREGKTVGDVLSQLENGGWAGRYSHMPVEEVDVKLPRMDVTAGLELNKAMKALGMERAFDENYAEFPLFCDQDTYLGLLKHDARLTLDEEGTEAAAITVGVIIPMDGDYTPTVYTFHADRPFLYVISEEATGLIYFIGQMTDGTEQQVTPPDPTLPFEYTDPESQVVYVCDPASGTATVREEQWSKGVGDGDIGEYPMAGSPDARGDIVIPGHITADGRDYQVTAVGRGAFLNNKGITSVILPDGLAKIGGSAFSGCGALTQVHLPAALTTIEEGLFRHCQSLTAIDIPQTVTTIGDGAFYACGSLKSIHIPASVTNIHTSEDCLLGSCHSLESITVDAANPAYDSREDCNAIIRKNTRQLIAGCQSTVIPDGVRSIGDYAFQGHNQLTAISLPASITKIGYRAFIFCHGLKEVTSNIAEPFATQGFDNVKAHAVLLVPAGTHEKYLAAGWNFKDIREMGEVITGVGDALRPSAGGSIYSLSGQRVSSPRKGLYVRDGKKVLIP